MVTSRLYFEHHSEKLPKSLKVTVLKTVKTSDHWCKPLKLWFPGICFERLDDFFTRGSISLGIFLGKPVFVNLN